MNKLYNLKITMDNLNTCNKEFNVNDKVIDYLNKHGIDYIIFGSKIYKFINNLDVETYDTDIAIFDENIMKHLFFKDFIKIQQNYNNTLISISEYRTNGSKIHISIFTSKEEFLINLLITCRLDFLKNIYDSKTKKIYYMLEDSINVKIPTNVYNKSSNLTIINKYINKYGLNVIMTKGEIIPVKQGIRAFKKMEEEYNKIGLVVIPLSDIDGMGKRPAIQGWNNLSNDFKINWSKSVYNIGILCGENSGIVCLDIDVKRDGLKTFNEMLKHYTLPICPVQNTPNGGKHYIFKYNKEKMANMHSAIAKTEYKGENVGIDFLIKNSQFVAEPSVNCANKREYKWERSILNTPIPEMPQWVYQLYNVKKLNDDYTICSEVDILRSEIEKLKNRLNTLL